MNHIVTRITLWIFLHSFCFCSFAQIQITSNLNTTASGAEVLANNLVGGGVSVSNVVFVGTPAVSGINSNSGLFTNGDAIGISSGIILTTGNVLDVNGPNSSAATSTNWGFNSYDPDLNAISANEIYDCIGIELDFFSAGDNVFMELVFGSEEYPEYVNFGASDIIGIFISGPGISGTENIAVIPGTTTPICIDNINSASFSSYFNNNDNGLTDIECDGFTDVVLVSKQVTPGEIYHLKILIADGGDNILDSWLFLKSASFISCDNGPSIDLGDDLIVCQDTIVTFDAGPGFSSYTWNTGAVSQSITVSTDSLSNGLHNYYAMVDSDSSCFGTGIVSIKKGIINPSPFLGPNLIACSDVSVTLATDSSFFTVWSTGDFTNFTTIDSSGVGEGTKTVWAQITNQFGCTSSDTILVKFQNPGSFSIGPDLTDCPENEMLVQAPTGYLSYLWSNGSTGSSTTLIGSVIGTEPFLLSLTVTDTIGCILTDSLTVDLIDSVITNAGTNIFLCSSDSMIIIENAQAENYDSLIWSTCGSGILLNTGSVTPEYLASPADINAGAIYFYLQGFNECGSSTDSMFLVVSDNPAMYLPDTIYACYADSFILAAIGTQGDYHWEPDGMLFDPDLMQPGGIAETDTLFTVVLNSSCGTASDSVFLNVSPASLSIVSHDTTICQYGIATLDAGPGFQQYLWSNGQSTQTTLIAGDSSLYGNNYVYVLVTNDFGCQLTDTFLVTVDLCTSFNKNQPQSDIHVYPQPASDVLTVSFQNNFHPHQILLLNYEGKEILKILPQSDSQSIEIGNLPAGYYYLQIISPQNIQTIPVIIAH
ncbi:MAG: T9SS type A sorting domain-containing protein [Bacteroidetes bacterium]|nr:T9SS type A sorting domain-containing protein [Bacteroidota bacterium]MBU1719150.1 T9SS type A sorting domain-containing protein [Bacteroidota bacterium]